jgi:hypothetical protein
MVPSRTRPIGHRLRRNESPCTCRGEAATPPSVSRTPGARSTSFGCLVRVSTRRRLAGSFPEGRCPCNVLHDPLTLFVHAGKDEACRRIRSHAGTLEFLQQLENGYTRPLERRRIVPDEFAALRISQPASLRKRPQRFASSLRFRSRRPQSSAQVVTRVGRPALTSPIERITLMRHCRSRTGFADREQATGRNEMRNAPAPRELHSRNTIHRVRRDID